MGEEEFYSYLFFNNDEYIIDPNDATLKNYLIADIWLRINDV